MKNIVIERYDNIHKFVDIIKNRPYNGVSGLNNASVTSDSNFAGMPLNSAYESCVTGIPDKKDVLQKAVCNFAERVNGTQRKTRNYYYGYSPNVGRALLGYPKAMKQRIKTPKKTKAIHIIYNPTNNCGTKAETIERASIATLNLIYSLESAETRCKLTILPMFAGSNNDVAYCAIDLKDYSDSFDFIKLSFPLTQVAFFRRLGFKWLEGVNGLKTDWFGYGSSVRDETILSKINNDTNYCYLTVDKWVNVNFDVNKMIDNIQNKKVGA